MDIISLLHLRLNSAISAVCDAARWAQRVASQENEYQFDENQINALLQRNRQIALQAAFNRWNPSFFQVLGWHENTSVPGTRQIPFSFRKMSLLLARIWQFLSTSELLKLKLDRSSTTNQRRSRGRRFI